MSADIRDIAEREERYRKFWKRRVAGKYRSPASQEPQVEVYAFLPTWNPWAPAHSYLVYVTGGLSDARMPEAAPGGPARIELSCYAKHVTGFGNPQKDPIAKWLHAFARLPFQENLPIRPGNTFDVGQPLAPGSEMSAFYFALTPLVDKDGLCRSTPNADAVIHLIPISETERAFADREGPEALTDALRQRGVRPIFDLARRSSL